MARLVLPHLRRNGWGRIVNVAGLAGLQPSPLIMPVGLNNAGILNVMKALADAEASHNILVTTVCPGPILTERQTRLLQDAARAKGTSVEEAEREATGAIPLKRMGRPEEVADTVAFLASERASYITGSLVLVDGGSGSATISNSCPQHLCHAPGQNSLRGTGPVGRLARIRRASWVGSPCSPGRSMSQTRIG